MEIESTRASGAAIHGRVIHFARKFGIVKLEVAPIVEFGQGWTVRVVALEMVVVLLGLIGCATWMDGENKD